MSSANRDSLTFIYLFVFPLFFFLPAWNSTTMLNRSGGSGHSYLFPDLRENGFSFSPLSIMLAVSLSYIAFTMLRYILSIPSFLKLLS
jgi:hypothetical protein